MTSYLIGNGINRAAGRGPSWSEVLISLAGHNRPIDQLQSKPFPLLFQELTARHWPDVKSKKLRGMVARQVGEIKPGDLHTSLIKRPVQNVLTTNYDYALEAATKHERGKWESSTKYSIFRHRVAEGKRIWHLHGEAEEPRSIMLGYDHYTGAVQRMRDYLKRSYHGRSSPFKSKKPIDRSGEPFSWIDVFLRDDVEILGLGFDYSEIDLWWAITYKNQLRRRGWTVGSTRYWAIDCKRSTEGEAKYALMESLDVVIERIDVNKDWHEAWERAIAKLPA